MKFALLPLCLAILGLVSSCQKSDDGPSLTSLSGTWQEVEQHPQFAGSTYRITFDEHGAFRLHKALFTDIIEINPQPCSDSRVQYARGTYAVNGRSISFSGLYCDSTYSHDVPDCSSGASFREDHQLRILDGWLILDPGRSEYERIHLRRE